MDVPISYSVVKCAPSGQVLSFGHRHFFLYWIKLLWPLWISCSDFFDDGGIFVILVTFDDGTPLMSMGSKGKRMNGFGHWTVHITMYFGSSGWYS